VAAGRRGLRSAEPPASDPSWADRPRRGPRKPQRALRTAGCRTTPPGTGQCAVSATSAGRTTPEPPRTEVSGQARSASSSSSSTCRVSRLGLPEIASLELRYVDTVELKEETVTIPLHVNVVPGDEAAGRTVNPVVATELAFQEVQRAKREASRRLCEGDAAGGAVQLGLAGSAIAAGMGMAAAASKAEMSDEASVIDQMVHEARYGEMTRASKRLSSDAARKSRPRGRRDIRWNQALSVP
jgi:hypothetical protein